MDTIKLPHSERNLSSSIDPVTPANTTGVTGITANVQDLSQDLPGDLPDTPATTPVASPGYPGASVQVELSLPGSFIPFMETENAKYGMIDMADCIRSEEHKSMFPDRDDIDTSGTIESYEKNRRVKPVFVIPTKLEGRSVVSVIDGEKYLDFKRNKREERVFVCILLLTDADEILKLMAQLQRSNHNSLMSLFNIIQSLWPVYYKGQGYRSDLKDDQFDQELPYGDGTKKLNIYEKIGKEIGLSGNVVKFIRKIGMVNPLHFKQIETGKSAQCDHLIPLQTDHLKLLA